MNGEIIHRGWLLKRDGVYRKRRFFRLVKTTQEPKFFLSYHAASTEDAPLLRSKGTLSRRASLIPLVSSTTVAINEAYSGRYFAFDVTISNGYIYPLRAVSDAERAEWVSKITTAIARGEDSRISMRREGSPQGRKAPVEEEDADVAEVCSEASSQRSIDDVSHHRGQLSISQSVAQKVSSTDFDHLQRNGSVSQLPRKKKKFWCFLSHFKREAGTEARLVHEKLKDVGPNLSNGHADDIFLDSDDLKDLRSLLSMLSLIIWWSFHHFN